MASAELGNAPEHELPAELTDSDYPPVGGFVPTTNLNPKTTTTAVLEKSHITRLLKSEGYGVNDQQVVPLNFFPSPMDSFQYGLYQFGIKDIYIVVMINKRRKSVYGHHLLDLTQTYSLEEDLVTRMRSQSSLG